MYLDGEQRLIQKDEWYFCQARESILKNITPDTAFNSIEDIAQLVLQQVGLNALF